MRKIEIAISDRFGHLVTKPYPGMGKIPRGTRRLSDGVSGFEISLEWKFGHLFELMMVSSTSFAFVLFCASGIAMDFVAAFACR